MNIPLDELLVLDYILSAQGAAISSAQRDDLMRWRDLRERVWRGIIDASLVEGPAPVDLTEAECTELLAMLPTTFRWGTGEDVGFALKRRIADELWGAEQTERHEKMMKMKALFQGGSKCQ